VNGQLHTQTALPRGERAPGTHGIGGWAGPRVSLGAMEKKKNLAFAGNRTRAVQPRSPSLYRLNCRDFSKLVMYWRTLFLPYVIQWIDRFKLNSFARFHETCSAVLEFVLTRQMGRTNLKGTA
jgi:hypothetical protein